MSKKYRVNGTFCILYSLSNHKDKHKEEISTLQNIIKIALEDSHIKVMQIWVQKITEEE